MTTNRIYMCPSTNRRWTNLVASIRSTLVRRTATKTDGTAVVAPWRFS